MDTKTTTKAFKTVADIAPGYEIRKFKSFRGMEGLGFDLDLHRDGRRVATVLDGGNGGMVDFRFVSDDELGRFTQAALAHAAANPDPDDGIRNPEDKRALSCSREVLIGAMADALETERRFRRACKTKTMAQVGDEIGSDQFLVFRKPFSPEVKAAIVAKYPGKRVLFLNEELAR
jgi:hypothetical protein